MAGVLRISSTARCDCGPATITTELVSPGFWRKATPNPTASSNGKTNTQNMTSGSRHISVKRVFTNCRKAIQRALPRGPAVREGFGVVLETAGWVSVAIAQILNLGFRVLPRPVRVNFLANVVQVKIQKQNSKFPHSSRKCLPVKLTKTSSRLACL